jgi:hypothetical protein
MFEVTTVMLITVNALCALSSDKWLPTFRRRIITLSSKSSSPRRVAAFLFAHTPVIFTCVIYSNLPARLHFLDWLTLKWRHYCASKCQWLTNRHGATAQKSLFQQYWVCAFSNSGCMAQRRYILLRCVIAIIDICSYSSTCINRWLTALTGISLLLLTYPKSSDRLRDSLCAYEEY